MHSAAPRLEALRLSLQLQPPPPSAPIRQPFSDAVWERQRARQSWARRWDQLWRTVRRWIDRGL